MYFYYMNTNEFLEEGKKTENKFAKDLIAQEGGKVSESTEKEDKFDHIDVKWEPPKGRKCTFDVKGMKKTKKELWPCTRQNNLG